MEHPHMSRIHERLQQLKAAGCGVLFIPSMFRPLPELRAHVRPIYRRLGIIPEVATGLQASDLTES